MPMQMFAILRRKGWPDGRALEVAAKRSSRVGDEEMSDRIRWIRSYVLAEEDGTVGTVCIYQAADEEAVREHARRAELPADAVIPISGTVVVRPDPQPAEG
jgi:hypothetical protein